MANRYNSRMEPYKTREILQMTYNEAFKRNLKLRETLNDAKERGADPEVIAGIEEEFKFIADHMNRNKSDPYGIR